MSFSVSNSLCYAHTAGLPWTCSWKSVNMHLLPFGWNSNCLEPNKWWPFLSMFLAFSVINVCRNMLGIHAIMLEKFERQRKTGDYQIDRTYCRHRTRNLSTESIEHRPAYSKGCNYFVIACTFQVMASLSKYI